MTRDAKKPDLPKPDLPRSPATPRPWGCRIKQQEDGQLILRAYRWSLWRLAIILPVTLLWNGFFWALFALSAVGLYHALGGWISDHLKWMLIDYGLLLPWGGSAVVTLVLFIFILPGLMMIATAYDHLAGEVQVTLTPEKLIVEQGVWPAAWRDEVQRSAIAALSLASLHDEATTPRKARKILIRTREGQQLFIGQSLPRHRLRWLHEAMLAAGVLDVSAGA